MVDQFISLVNPEKPIQPFVVKLTGINSAMLRSAPKFYEVAKRIIEITEGTIVVAHNASFDYRILQMEFRRLGFDFKKPTLCTVELAKKINTQVQTGNIDGLTDEEVAFYDALEINEAAVRQMQHEDLVRLAQELTKKVKENIKVDWSVRESTQAALRVMVRDLLDKYGYPPDFSKQAIETVVKQAESLTEEWLEQKLNNIS